MVKWSRLLPLLGFFVLIYLLLTIDLSALGDSIRSLNIWYFILAALISIPSVFIKSLKWNVIAKEFNAKGLAIKKTLLYWLAGFAFGTVTPGNVGDFYRSLYLKKHKVSSVNAFMTVFIDRAIDVVILLIAGFLGLVILATRFFSELAPLLKSITIILCAILFVGAVFMKKSAAKSILRPIYRFLVPEKYKINLKFSFHQFYDDFALFRKRHFSVSAIFLLSVICWFVVIFQYFILSLGANIEISFIEVLLFMPLVIILEALPISFNGAGPREAGLVFFLSFFGVSAPQAITVGLSMLIINLFITGVGGVILLKNPAEV